MTRRQERVSDLRTGRSAAFLSATVLLGAGPLYAQTEPGKDPALTDPAVQRDAEHLSRPSSSQDGSPALQPLPREGSAVAAGGVLPGLEGGDLRPSAGTLVREGAFLANRRGRLVAGERGGWVFVFDADAEGNAEPPMQLQPCQRLTEMQRIAGAKGGAPTFLVSGTVQVFEGANYLLPRIFTTLASESLASSAAGGADESNAGAGAAPAGGADPSVRELLRTVGSTGVPAKDGPAARPPQGGGAGGGAGGRGAAVEVSSEEGKLLREGSMLVSRRGRVERGGDTGWIFILDNDPDSATKTPTRFGLMRCQNTGAISSLIQSNRGDLVFSVSGEVYVFGGRNYLLPTMFLVERDREGNIVSGQ